MEATDRTGPLRSILLSFIALSPAVQGAEAPSPASRAIVVVRVGALAPEEVSPRSKGLAKESWSLAEDGVSLARVDPPPGAPESWSANTLAEDIFGADPGTPTAVATEAPWIVDFRRAEAPVPNEAPVERPGATANPLAAVEAIWGRPPAPTPEERAALASLAQVLSPGAPPALAAEAPPAEPSAPPSTHAEPKGLEGLATASTALVWIPAASAAEDAIEARETLLRRVRAAGGNRAHWIFISLPLRGDASVTFVGPSFRVGRIIDPDGRRSWKTVAAVVGRVLGRASALDRVSAEVLEEIFHE